MNIPRIINGGMAIDDRGSLKFVNDFDFSGIKRFYQVENHGLGFIRAWHGHWKEGKYVYVVSGTALVGAVSMSSPELPEKFVLSSSQPKVLWIPPGYANGFKNLTNSTIILFFSTSSIEESRDDDIRFPWDKDGWDIWEDRYR